MECTEPSPSHQLHPHSHHRPLHSIPIRPGLISISVVTAARGLAGRLGPHSPSVRALSLIFLPVSPAQPGPSFSLISVVILCRGATTTSLPLVYTLLYTLLYTLAGCTLHHYLPLITLPILTTWLDLQHRSPLSLCNLPLKHPSFLSVSLTVYLIQVNRNYKSN